MKNSNFEQHTIAELTQYAIEHLKDCKPTCYGCDLHHEIFNTDYYIIGYYDAEEWLKNNGGIFSNIEIIKDYENDNFGDVNTDFSSSEAVCNMIVYIAGENVLQQSQTLQDNWNKRLDEDDIQMIINELEDTI
jgi:hypothetical protein